MRRGDFGFLNTILLIFINVYVWLPTCLYGHLMFADSYRREKDLLDPLEMELESVMIQLIRVLRTKFRSSASAGHCLNQGAISSAQIYNFDIAQGSS